MSDRFKDEMRRINYVTPTSYLELLSTYKRTYKDRKKEVYEGKIRLERGLNVLANASVEVAKLQQMLIESQPELERT